MTGQITNVVDDLYEGVFDETAWKRGILGIIDSVHGSGGLIFSVNPVSLQVLRDEEHRIDPVFMHAYRTEYAHLDIRFKPGFVSPLGEPITEGELIPVAEWKRSQIYNELLFPGDVPWILAFWLHKTPRKFVVFSIQGSRQRGPFQRADGDLIKPFVEHLKRALEMKDRLADAKISQEALSSSLDTLSCGVIILDASGKIKETSFFAQRLIQMRAGISSTADGTLKLAPPGNRHLARILFARHEPSHSDIVFHVHRQHALPLSIIATRLPRNNVLWFGKAEACWLLLIFDPEAQIETSIEVVARDFSLSAREAEIACLLATGHRLKSISERLTVSVHTTRAHLKSIFSKLQVRSQSELVQKMRRSCL